MRTTFNGLLLLALFPVLLLAAIPQKSGADAAKSNPADILIGTWRADISDTQSVLLQLGKHTIDWKLEAGGQVTTLMSGHYSLPKDKPESHMDWTDMKAGERDSPDNLCLYRLAGDTLLLIGGGPQNRPTKFYTGPGGEPRTLIFSRVPPEKQPAK